MPLPFSAREMALGACICISIVVFLLPFQISYYWQAVIIVANVYAIIALSWNLISGYTGYISFGHGSFFGIAAYSTAFLTLWFSVPPLACVLIGGLAAVPLGWLMGLSTLRLKGPYFALFSLTVTLLLYNLVFVFWKYTNGYEGLSGIPGIFSDKLGYYFLSFALLLVVFTVVYKISRSRFGLILKGIREDELAVEVLGIDTNRYKISALLISSFFTGITRRFLCDVHGVRWAYGAVAISNK